MYNFYEVVIKLKKSGMDFDVVRGKFQNVITFITKDGRVGEAKFNMVRPKALLSNLSMDTLNGTKKQWSYRPYGKPGEKMTRIEMQMISKNGLKV